MKQIIKVNAKSYEQALDKVLSQLNLKKDQVDIKLIDKKKALFSQPTYQFEIIKIQKDEDASYDIIFQNDGVYLVVYPAKGKGKAIDQQKLLEDIKRRKIEDVDIQSITKAIASVQEYKQKIAPAQEEKKIDAMLFISIDNDAYTAYGKIIPPINGKMIDYHTALKQIEQKGIKFGIQHDELKSYIQQQKFNQSFVIARGVLPEDGKDAEIRYFFKKDKHLKPKILNNGKVDYHELDLVENIRKGQCIAEIIPASEGKDGMNVYGQTINAKHGKKPNIKLGKNVEFKDNKIIATEDGQVVLINNVINIYRVYEVNGDVNNSTGNIDFVGNIIIKGNVLTGFKVKAGGNIDIFGAVEGATIEAGGDIRIRQGVQGRNIGYITTKGDLVCSFIENAKVVTGGKIVVDAILHSHVYCNDTIEASGKRGIIVGGVVKALVGIKAKTIGSNMYTLTEIEVGSDPLLREEHNKLKEDLNSKKQEIEKTEKIISLLNKHEKKSALDKSKQQLKIKAIKSKLSLINDCIKLQDKISLFEQKIENLTKGKVSVLKKVYPGVKITIGKSLYEVKNEIKYCTFKRQEGDIKLSAYEDI